MESMNKSISCQFQWPDPSFLRRICSVCFLMRQKSG